MKEILSKEEFVAHMEGLKTEYDKHSQLYSEFGIDTIEMRWCYSTNHFLELLEKIMNDEQGEISWWCYETDFGRDETMTEIIVHDDAGERSVVVNTPEDLYDYLVRG